MNETVVKSRSPICTVLGHIDAGKTSLLDYLRKSSVTAAEEGGITQRIGLTEFSYDALYEMTKSFNKKIELPGLMFIDTPGHECFSNQRICATNISDFIVLVVDLFKGLELQTVECINLLKSSKTPFIVVVNKIDRLDGFISSEKIDKKTKIKSNSNSSLKKIFEQQKKDVMKRLEQYIKTIEIQFAENGLNATVYYKNLNPREYISLVPISAKTGDGIPDMLMLIGTLSTKFLKKKLKISGTVTEGYIIERIKDTKYGELFTAVITDGEINLHDLLLLFDEEHNIVEHKIQKIFVSEKSKEIKDKITLKSVTNVNEPKPILLKFETNNISMGSKFFGFKNEEEKITRHEQLQEIALITTDSIDKEFDKYGLYINVPTVSMGDALYKLLKTKGVPIAGINIGILTKINIIKASSIHSLEHSTTNEDKIYNQRYSVILAYDVTVSDELMTFATESGVTILSDGIIFRLVEKYAHFIKDLNKKILNLHPSLGLPMKAQILEKYIFLKRNPILIGIKVLENSIKTGMPVSTTLLHNSKKVKLGRITSIQKNNNTVSDAQKGEEICVKIERIDPTDAIYEYGKDFDYTCTIESFYTLEESRIVDKYSDVFEN